MRAMIFAAGVGSRLKPLTDSTPKALIKIHDRPMIEWVILNLISQGIKEIIINLHHFPDKIKNYLKEKDHFGIRIEYSHENVLLDTGGGLKKASWFFKETEPFLVYNTDIISDLDIKQMLNFHIKKNADVTLAVRQRQTSRYFIFNTNYRLSGWTNVKENKTLWVDEYNVNDTRAAFSGIHIISGKIILDQLSNLTTFSIVPEYIRLASEGLKIFGFNTEHWFWFDLGSKSKIERAEKIISPHFFRKLSGKKEQKNS